MAFLGDDFLGVGASPDAKRWTSMVAADYGWTEKDFGFGGTGYSTGGTLAGGRRTPRGSRQFVATAPSIVIVEGGRFDIQSPNGPTKIKNRRHGYVHRFAGRVAQRNHHCRKPDVVVDKAPRDACGGRGRRQGSSHCGCTVVISTSANRLSGCPPISGRTRCRTTRVMPCLPKRSRRHTAASRRC